VKATSLKGRNRFHLVTVVVPVFNRVCLLGATIESVLEQCSSDWELIVVDDGSQQDVRSFVARYPDPRIRFIRQENQGNAVARNTGIQEAEGEYIICLDSDDIWQSTMLETCVAFLAAHPAVDVVYTQVQAINGTGQLLPRAVGPMPRGSDLLEPLLMGYPILPSSALVRRSCFERWGAYTPGLDDWELWLRWAVQGCRFACIEQPLLQYRLHDQNFNLDWERRRATHFAMLDRFYARENLPEVAYRLRQRAYANQHFRFAVLAWQVGRPADGLTEFAEAALGDPAYLTDLDFYTQLACAHQGRLDAGTQRGLDLGIAASTLNQSLEALFARPELPPELWNRRATAWGWAYLALARLAYGVADDMASARRYLGRALQVYPPLLWRTDWAVWMGRAVLGRHLVRTVKQMVHLGGVYA